VTLALNWKDVPVASTKHTLVVLEPQGGKPLPVSARLVRTLPHSERMANVFAVRFMPDGKLFTAGYPSGIVQVWDPTSGKEIRRIDSPRGYRGSADYARTDADMKALYVPMDGRKVVRLDDPKKRFRIEYNGEVLVWDLLTGKARPALKADKGRGVMAGYLSPDGTRLITVERAGGLAGEEPAPDMVRMIDTTTGKAKKIGEGYAQVVFSKDSQRAYVCTALYGKTPTKKLAVVDREGTELAVIPTATKLELGSPVLSPDEKLLLVSASKGRINQPGELIFIDLATNKEVGSISSGGDFPFFTPVFSPDGKYLAASDYNERVTIWDVAKRTIVRRQAFKGKAPGWSLAFSPDSRRLAVPMRVKTDADRARDPDPLDFPQPRVFLFDLDRAGDPEEIVCPHGWLGGIAFSRDGKTLALGSAGTVHLFDVTKRD
jgi:WD40 repeat protein